MTELNEIPLPRRVGWGVLFTLILTGLNAAFLVGGYVMVVAEHGKDIEVNKRSIERIQNENDAMRETLIRIDANVSYLAERAREDRERFSRGGQ